MNGSLRRGQAFIGRDSGAHLWFILSDPAQDPDRVLIVNVTTWERSPFKDPRAFRRLL